MSDENRIDLEHLARIAAGMGLDLDACRAEVERRGVRVVETEIEGERRAGCTLPRTIVVNREVAEARGAIVRERFGPAHVEAGERLEAVRNIMAKIEREAEYLREKIFADPHGHRTPRLRGALAALVSTHRQLFDVVGEGS